MDKPPRRDHDKEGPANEENWQPQSSAAFSVTRRSEGLGFFRQQNSGDYCNTSAGDGRSAELQLCAAQFVIIAQNWILRSATTHPHY